MSLLNQSPREYLVFCKGHPTVYTTWVRLDALARIARSALAKKRVVHLLFEDSTLVSLFPEFLGTGPWGSPLTDTSEARLGELLSDLRLGKRIGGARIRIPGRDHMRALIDAIGDVMGDERAPRFSTVFSLRERGCFLDFSIKADMDASVEPGAGICGRVLFDLGGVRDILPVEDSVMRALCLRFCVPYHLVSLGANSELSSKCIKTVEVAAELGLLMGALDHALKVDCCPSVGSISEMGTRKGPQFLHIVVAANSSLDSFCVRPAAAGLIVDVFVGSFSLYQNTALSLIGTDGIALTMRRQPREPFPAILSESNALAFLATQKRFQASVAEVLAEQQFALGRNDLREVLLIHADSDAKPFEVAEGKYSAPPCESIALVFAPRARGSEVAQIGATAGSYAHVAINSFLAGPAFLRMCHNEGILANVKLCSLSKDTFSESSTHVSSSGGAVHDDLSAGDACAEFEIESSWRTSASELEALACDELLAECFASVREEMEYGKGPANAPDPLLDAITASIISVEERLAYLDELKQKQCTCRVSYPDQQIVSLDESSLRTVLAELVALQDSGSRRDNLALDLNARIKRNIEKLKKIHTLVELEDRELNAEQLALVASEPHVRAALRELCRIAGDAPEESTMYCLPMETIGCKPLLTDSCSSTSARKDEAETLVVDAVDPFIDAITQAIRRLEDEIVHIDVSKQANRRSCALALEPKQSFNRKTQLQAVMAELVAIRDSGSGHLALELKARIKRHNKKLKKIYSIAQLDEIERTAEQQSLVASEPKVRAVLDELLRITDHTLKAGSTHEIPSSAELVGVSLATEAEARKVEVGGEVDDEVITWLLWKFSTKFDEQIERLKEIDNRKNRPLGSHSFVHSLGDKGSLGVRRAVRAELVALRNKIQRSNQVVGSSLHARLSAELAARIEKYQRKVDGSRISADNHSKKPVTVDQDNSLDSGTIAAEILSELQLMQALVLEGQGQFVWE